MQNSDSDWLKVVYGSELDREPADRVHARTEIAVRQTPADPDLVAAPEGEQRVRVTVVPSGSGQAWTLWLRDFGPGPGDAPTARVWWRVEPGTWQPLGGTRQCVAEGRGRIRLDVALRLADDTGPAPRLRFVAEPG